MRDSPHENFLRFSLIAPLHTVTAFGIICAVPREWDGLSVRVGGTVFNCQPHEKEKARDMDNNTIDFTAMADALNEANAVKAATEAAFAAAQHDTVARLEREYTEIRADRDRLAAFVLDNLANAPDSGFNRGKTNGRISIHAHEDGTTGIELTFEAYRDMEARDSRLVYSCTEFNYHNAKFPRGWAHDASGLVRIRTFLDSNRTYNRALAWEVNAEIRRMTEKRTQRLADVARIAAGDAAGDGRQITITINA